MVEGGGAGRACPSIPGTKSTLVLVTPQADAIYNMIGYPKFIMDPKELDKVFNDVSWSDMSPGSPIRPSTSMCRTCAHHHGLRAALNPRFPPERVSLMSLALLRGISRELVGQFWGG